MRMKASSATLDRRCVSGVYRVFQRHLEFPEIICHLGLVHRLAQQLIDRLGPDPFARAHCSDWRALLAFQNALFHGWRTANVATPTKHLRFDQILRRAR